MTRTLFLGESEEAVREFETFIERAGSSELAPQAQQEIGEIYFSRLAQYSKAINFYQKLLELHKFPPDEEAKFMYRVARSYFLTNQIKRSIEWLEKLSVLYPKSTIYERAQFDLANAWYALGDSDKGAYSKGLKLFRELSQRTQYKNHTLYVGALFGEASTLEELEQFNEADLIFKKIENDYPAPNIIKIRKLRIEERRKKKRK